jgi:F0F1-type ATP synthase assembly protein I
MSNLLPTNRQEANWKTQSYLIGVIGGTILGVIAAYFYTRAATDDTQRTGLQSPNRVQTGDLLGLGLAILAILRQVAELGRTPDQDGKKRRR